MVITRIVNIIPTEQDFVARIQGNPREEHIGKDGLVSGGVAVKGSRSRAGRGSDEAKGRNRGKVRIARVRGNRAGVGSRARPIRESHGLRGNIATIAPPFAG